MQAFEPSGPSAVSDFDRILANVKTDLDRAIREHQDFQKRMSISTLTTTPNDTVKHEAQGEMNKEKQS